MEENDKPYVCPVSSCGMRFASEDHCTSHKQKHDMSLNLSSTAAQKAFSFTDQTPTPTRFIKNCDEVGLFQDLQHVNPFDEQFRRASQSGATPVIQSPEATDSLNTPCIPPFTADVQHPLVPRSKYALILGNDLTLEDLPAVKEAAQVETSLQKNNKLVPEVKQPNSNDGLKAERSEMVSNVSLVAQSSRGQTPVIMSTGSLKPPKLSGVPTAVVVKSPTILLPTNKPTIPKPNKLTSPILRKPPMQVNIQPAPTQSVQLILKLPDGQSVPVNISNLPPASPGPILIKPPSTSSGLTFAGALSEKSKPVLPNGGMVGSYVTIKPQTNLVNTTGNLVATVQPTRRTETRENHASSQENNRKRRQNIVGSDDKRQMFLERNRAAATRCRQKRKRWVNELEGRAEELSRINENLQHEVAILRNEVAQLKTMLLAHKDCPITLQMMAANQSQGGLSLETLCQSQNTVGEGMVNEGLSSQDAKVLQRMDEEGTSAASPMIIEPIQVFYPSQDEENSEQADSYQLQQ